MKVDLLLNNVPINRVPLLSSLWTSTSEQYLLEIICGLKLKQEESYFQLIHLFDTYVRLFKSG